MLLSEKGSEENNNIFLQCEVAAELWNIFLKYLVWNSQCQNQERVHRKMVLTWSEQTTKEGMDNDPGLNLVDHMWREKC